MAKQKKTDFDLSVVILSFNTKDLIRKCLSELKRSITQSKLSVEVIVVENNSTDNSGEIIKTEFPWVKLIIKEENTGFSKGNNIGMSSASGRYILLINSDIFVQPNTLRQAAEYINNNPSCDIFGCQLRFADGRIQPSWGYLPNLKRIFSWWLPLFNDPQPVHPKWLPDEPTQVEWFMGAFMYLKREVYEKTGGFDENMFLYMEEVEWFYRIKQNGFSAWYNPNFWVTHLDKGSSQGKSYKALIKEADGLKYYMKKHMPGQAALCDIAIKAGSLLRFIHFVFKDKDLANAYLSIFLGKK